MEKTLEICAYVGSYIGYIIGGEILFIAPLISAKMGDLNLYLVLFSVFLSAMTVDWFFFFVGRKQGQPYVDKRPKMKAKVEKVSRWFEQYPNLLLLVYRYLFGFRIVVPIMIGLTDYSWTRFLLITIFGGIIWVILFGFLGYHCADQILKQLHFIQEHIWLFIIGLAVIGIGYRSYTKRKMLQTRV
ncbi:MAG: DedA family protein [Bacteroidota bacterium]